MIGCGSKTQVITRVTTVPITIPDNMLEKPIIDKPKVSSISDIKKVFIDLKLGYDSCILKLDAIKELNERYKNE
ncbi:hypothetical protein ACRXIF_001669 [Campylobacter jejuni]